jgi:hypothetical protein
LHFGDNKGWAVHGGLSVLRLFRCIIIPRIACMSWVLILHEKETARVRRQIPHFQI